MNRFADKSSVELRLDLTEAEYERARAWNGIFRKKNLIRDITRELIERGSF